MCGLGGPRLFDVAPVIGSLTKELSQVTTPWLVIDPLSMARWWERHELKVGAANLPAGRGCRLLRPSPATPGGRA